MLHDKPKLNKQSCVTRHPIGLKNVCLENICLLQLLMSEVMLVVQERASRVHHPFISPENTAIVLYLLLVASN